MKKNSYYFSLLSEVEQGQYKSNYENFAFAINPKSFEDFLNKESDSFEDFIATGFLWQRTTKNQGNYYWMKISERPEPKEPTDQDTSIVLILELQKPKP